MQPHRIALAVGSVLNCYDKLYACDTFVIGKRKVPHQTAKKNASDRRDVKMSDMQRLLRFRNESSELLSLILF